MCELLAMSSLQPSTLTLSLKTLAHHGGGSGPHADGWGVAYYDGDDVRRIRDPDPAHDSPWVRFIAERGIQSDLVVSHIRKATQGKLALSNTQPFSREMHGRMHVFAHNGDVPSIFESPDFGSTRFHSIGDTDSEFAFCNLLERLWPAWQHGTPSFERRWEIVCGFAKQLRELGLANFIYADGDYLFAYGHRSTVPDLPSWRPGLHWLHRSCPISEEFSGSDFSAAGLGLTTTQQVLLVATVPLSQEPWQAIAEGHLIAARDGELVAQTETCKLPRIQLPG